MTGLILLQKSEGSGMSGSTAASMFGGVLTGSAAGNFLTKTTAILATIFFVLCALLSLVVAKTDISGSLIISHKLLGTQEWFVIHHSDCGMLTFTNPVIHSLLDESLDTASLGPDGWYNETKNGGADSRHIDFQPISDLAQSVVDDVRTIRENPLVPKYIPIYGYIYDVKTGALVEVPAATQIGKAQ